MGYREYVSTHVFKPYGMTHSRFCAMDEVNDNVAEGYTLKSPGKWRKNIYTYPPIGTAEGGAYTTVGDLHLFMRSTRKQTLLCKPHSVYTRPIDTAHGIQAMALSLLRKTAKPCACIKKG